MIIVDYWFWCVVTYGQNIGCVVSWGPDDPNWEDEGYATLPELLLTCC